jgi:hypothetical protein
LKKTATTVDALDLSRSRVYYGESGDMNNPKGLNGMSDIRVYVPCVLLDSDAVL